MLDLVKKEKPVISKIPTSDDVSLGQWYWYVYKEDGSDKEERWLGCITEIGSNYVQITSPGHRSYYQERVHFDKFYETLVFEPNSAKVIKDNVSFHQNRIQDCLEEIREVTARLGVSEQQLLPEDKASSTDLVVLSGTDNVKKYKKDLVKAKDKTLPELFKKVDSHAEELSKWLTADTLTLEATMKVFKKSISKIENKIFSVQLYAGLTEEITQCSDGSPAPYAEKLRIMQRRLYMDEECLLDYQHGGMEFKNISEFDAWISKPINRDRIMPFPRCVVSMQIRRHSKERESDGTLSTEFINFQLNQADKFTYLYMRNGEQVYRLNCELDFGEMMFPDHTLYSPGEPMMVKIFAGRIDKMITLTDYEERCKEYEEQKIKEQKWTEENPEAHWMHNPYHNYSFDIEDWRPFDQSSVYFDDCLRMLQNEIEQYNRIAIIVQGLFDRSPIFHPHPPYKIWTPAGFKEAIELIYDCNALYAGEKPDFEAYRRKCNASLNVDSMVIGQERVWEVKEAERENARMENSHRHSGRLFYHKTFRPYGDPGPGYLSKMVQWTKTRKAIFKWTRERRAYNRYCDDNPIPCSLTVDEKYLFNVSAYKIGDFKQFFQDPRTRAEYLKWAPMLLTAEEYHVNKLKLRAAMKIRRD